MDFLSEIALLTDDAQSIVGRLVRIGRYEEAVAVQVEVVERLASVALGLNESTPSNEREAAQRVTWGCCHEPHLTRSRTGKPVWVASCRWSRGKRTGTLPRKVADGTKPKPKRVRLSGRSVKRC
jgi:hypothetical protein